MAKCVCTAGVVLGIALAAAGAPITFETLPGGTPTDGVAITDQYSDPADGGVSFYYIESAAPAAFQDPVAAGYEPMYMEATYPSGQDLDNNHGFGYGDAGDPQTYVFDYDADVDPQYDLDNFLLRGPDDVTARGPFTMVIKYTELTTAFCGQIWDIDENNHGTEQWQVRAFGQQNGQPWSDTSNPALLSPEGKGIEEPGTLDGKCWEFCYQTPEDVTVSEVHISFVGTKESTIGLAFDNFYSTAVPEPASLALVAAGGLLLAFRRTRRRTA